MSKEYSFSFTEEEANLIFTALQDLPYKISFSLISKIQAQFTNQNKPVEEVGSKISKVK